MKLRADTQASPYETKLRGRLRLRPNFRILGFTFAYNSERIFRLLSDHPGFARARFLFALSRLNCPNTGIDFEKELIKIYGATGGGKLGKWRQPDLQNAATYIIRNSGLSERDWSTSFFATAAEFDPYFFYAGIPRTPADDPVELTDRVVGKIVRSLVLEIPELVGLIKANR